MHYSCGLVDGSSEKYVCQLYHESWFVMYENEYFIGSRIENVLSVLKDKEALLLIDK